MVMGTVCDVLQDAHNKTIRKQPEMNERIFTLFFAPMTSAIERYVALASCEACKRWKQI